MATRFKRSIKTVLSSRWFWFVAAGYLLRIALMPVSGQNDALFMPWMTRFINFGHFNLYAFLEETYGADAVRGGITWAPYPYGFFLFTSGWLELLEKIGLIDMASWNSSWAVTYPARYVFLAKAAYLPFDLGIGYLLYRTAGRVGLALWAWSPAALYTPFMMGQNDIYPTAFAVAGTYAAAKAIRTASPAAEAGSRFPGKWALAASLLLGIGSVFKIYPILLIPPLAFVMERRWPQRLLLIALGCSVFVLASLPFLTTATYIESVLLSPEGTNIFRESDLLSIAVAPLLLVYVIFLAYLAADRRSERSPHTAWFVTLFVIATLLLWAPVQLYWLIWIIPFLIASVHKNRVLLASWAMVQVAFAFLLVARQHRELGIALPSKLGGSNFVMPNLEAALFARDVATARPFDIALPFINALFVVSLLAAIWIAIRALTGRLRESGAELQVHWWFVMPTVLLLSLLALNLIVASELTGLYVKPRDAFQTLITGDQFFQELDAGREKISGVRMRTYGFSGPAVLEVCGYADGDIGQAPATCGRRRVQELTENNTLYVTFDQPMTLQEGAAPVARLRLVGDGGSVTLPFTTREDRYLMINNNRVDGSLEIDTLSPFSHQQAIDRLLFTNILRDGRLLAVIVVTIGFTLLILGLITVRSQAIRPASK